MLVLLAALVALGPLSIDMYLPAMPSMKNALNTDISHIHLTLSSFLTGFALFHLACGPLADRFGRKPVLLYGTALFVIASLGCAQSDTVEELLGFRFVQGIGACVGPTLARTITRDLFGPREAARALSIIAMLMALAPAVAPSLGSFVLLVLPWPVIFVFLAVYGTAMVILLYLYLPESLPVRQSLHPLVIVRNYAQLFRDPYFLTVTLCSTLIYSTLMIYLSSSAFVYIDMLGVPIQFFGLIFSSTVIGYMAGSAISARLSRYYDSQQAILVGIILALLSTIIMWLGHIQWPLSVMALMLPMTLCAVGMGLVLPHAMAIALEPFPHIAGTASSMMGFLQMSLSAIATAITGYLLHDSPAPMIGVMLVVSGLALLLYSRVYWRYLSTKS